MSTDDRRMSDVEAMMWRLDKDPYLASTFANVTIVDRHIDFDRFLARMERTAMLVPHMHMRVQPAPGNFGNPTWVDDAAFDIRYHVRRISLPEPGSMRQLLDLATLIVADPFDRTRPLWQFFVVDGLQGGRGGLIAKLHHAISDGERGIEVSLNYLDFERDPAPLAPLDPEVVSRATELPTVDATYALKNAMNDSLRIPLALLRQVRDVLSDPALLGALGPQTVENVRGVLAQMSDNEPARSPLWKERTLSRRLDVLSAPYEELRAASKKLGGTLNAAFVTAAAQAAGAYHRTLDAPVESLRTSIAVSTRGEASGSNAFSLGRLLVPTGEMTLAERFAAVTEGLVAAREKAVSGSVDSISALGTMLPVAVVTRLARQQAQTVDFGTSNLRAANFPLYVGGARILNNYPAGPVAGTAFNLTLLSYDGYMDMGLHMDTGAITEPDLLRNEMQSAFDELVAMVPRTTKREETSPAPTGGTVKRRWWKLRST